MEENFTLEQAAVVAKKMLEYYPERRVFAFSGQMGAGKTTFIQTVCKLLCVQDTMSSPTFSLINQYTAAGDKPVYHIDLYRLKDEEEALQAGVEDCLFSGAYCFVEWPERATGLFPDDAVQVLLTVVNDNTRKLTTMRE